MTTKNNAALVDARLCKIKQSELLSVAPKPPLTHKVYLAPRGRFEHHPNGLVIYFVEIRVTGIDANHAVVWKGSAEACLSFKVDDTSTVNNRRSKEFVVLNHSELNKLIEGQAAKFQHHVLQMFAPEDPLFV